MSKKQPNVIVLSGYGLNCEAETLFAFERAGGKGDIVHINDLIDNPKQLEKYDILAVPGGFSFGDDTGSGLAYANKLKNHLSKELKAFVKRDTLVIGICNGFQILTHVGLLPGTLLHNDSARYVDRFVDVAVTGNSPWLAGIKTMSLPIAHGEGKYYIDDKNLKKLNNNNQVGFRYTKGDTAKFTGLPMNPNGAIEDIGCVTAYDGRVIGMMPHPERVLFFHQLPHWTYMREELERAGKKVPTNGPGLQLFKNAIRYFK